MIFTLDYVSYNDVMVSSLKARLGQNDGIVCDGFFMQVRCCAHILNLIVRLRSKKQKL